MEEHLTKNFINSPSYTRLANANNRKKVKKMKWKNVVITLMLAVMVLLPSALTATGSTVPEVSLSTTEIAPNQNISVDGTGFPSNQTVRIDLYLPSNIEVKGVSYAITDMNGTFNTTFIAPDSQEGYGYVEAISENISISKYVHFKGNVKDDLQIVLPDKIYAQNNTAITVKAPFLKDKNYILDVSISRPDSSQMTLYYVLHDGYCTFTREFQYIGEYSMYFSVEGTSYNNTTAFNVVSVKPENPNYPTQNTTNTIPTQWSVSANLNTFWISLNIYNTTVMSGNFYLYTPTGERKTIEIKNGVAGFTASTIGNYEVQYIYEKKIYKTQISFSPKLSLSTQVADDGLLTVKFSLNGKPYSVNATIYENAKKIDTIQCPDGVGTYNLPSSDSYSVKVSVFGNIATSNFNYEEQSKLTNLYTQADGNTLWIAGIVVGQYSGKELADRTVKIDITGIGTIYAKSDEYGKFTKSVTIPDNQLGNTIYIDVSSGNYQQTLSAKTEQNFWGEYGIYIVVIILLILAITYKLGYFDKYLKKGGGGATRRAFQGRQFHVGK